jgi:phosphopantothenoylcysteine synthetase/decarboxylase
LTALFSLQIVELLENAKRKEKRKKKDYEKGDKKKTTHHVTSHQPRTLHRILFV